MILTFKTRDKNNALRLSLVDSESMTLIAACKISHAGHLSGFVVNPDLRGEGYAKRLMQAALNNGAIPVVSLKVKPSKGSCLTFKQTSDFYAKHGFMPVDDSSMRVRVPSLGELDKAGYWVA